MGNNISATTSASSTSKIQRITFESIQKYIGASVSARHGIYMINTLPQNEQECLIPFTVMAANEVTIFEELLRGSLHTIRIIIYGKNCNDLRVFEKYKQLLRHGFAQSQLFIYLGGMFEWVLLQEIYGNVEFPTTTYELDLLKFRPQLTRSLTPALLPSSSSGPL